MPPRARIVPSPPPAIDPGWWALSSTSGVNATCPAGRAYPAPRVPPSALARSPLLQVSYTRREGYFFLSGGFTASLRMVPIFLSLRVSRPSGFLIVPGGSPCFFSNEPTVWSLLVFRGMYLSSCTE